MSTGLNIRVEGDAPQLPAPVVSQPTEALQNPLQAAIAKVSLGTQVAEAVLKALKPKEYLHGFDLYSLPSIRELVRDQNHLAVLLSEGFTYGKLGRVLKPQGTAKYAYGAPDPALAMVKQQKASTQRKKPVRQPVGKVPVGVHHAPKITPAAKPYTLTLEFDNAEEALAFMMKNGLVSKIVKG